MNDEQLRKRAVASSLDIWQGFRLPQRYTVVEVGEPSLTAIDRGYQVSREVAYVVADGGTRHVGRFVVDEVGMMHSNAKYFLDASLKVVEEAQLPFTAQRRVNSGLPPFDRETPVSEAMTHIAYWAANHIGFDQWYTSALFYPPKMQRRDGDIETAFDIKFFESPKDTVPSRGTFKIVVNPKSNEIKEAVCLRGDGSVFKTLDDMSKLEVYKDAGLPDPDPNAAKRKRSKLVPKCEAVAERNWRDMNFPPSIQLVDADPDFKVKDTRYGFVFERGFVYVEGGVRKNGRFRDEVSDSTITSKPTWFNAKGDQAYGHYEEETVPTRWDLQYEATSDEDAADRLAKLFAVNIEFEDKYEPSLVGKFKFEDTGDSITASKTLKYWKPGRDKFGPKFEALPSYAVFSLTMEKDTHRILDIGLETGDGHALGAVPQEFLDKVHEYANVPLRQPNPTITPPRSTRP